MHNSPVHACTLSEMVIMSAGVLVVSCTIIIFFCRMVLNMVQEMPLIYIVNVVVIVKEVHVKIVRLDIFALIKNV